MIEPLEDSGWTKIKVEELACERGTNGGDDCATIIIRLTVRFNHEKEAHTDLDLEATRATLRFDREMHFFNRIEPLIATD